MLIFYKKISRSYLLASIAFLQELKANYIWRLFCEGDGVGCKLENIPPWKLKPRWRWCIVSFLFSESTVDVTLFVYLDLTKRRVSLAKFGKPLFHVIDA